MLITLGAILLLAGCNLFMGEDGEDGKDGKDGTPYMSISWVGSLTFWSDDPAFAGESYIINEKYYIVPDRKAHFRWHFGGKSKIGHKKIPGTTTQNQG